MAKPSGQLNISSSLKSAVMPGMIVILLAAVILFLPSYIDSYVGDDFVQQWRIRDLIGAPLKALELFRPEWTNWYYRPLQNLWMLVNRGLFGLQPAISYYLQICWHVVGISLLYRAARGFGIGQLGSLAAACLFAINSAHHLTVDWISSIGIVASSTLSLAVIVLFNRYLNRARRNLYLILAFIFWLAALLFYETAVVIPLFLLLMWLSHPRRKKPSKPLLSAAAATLMVMVFYISIQLTRENANVSSESIFHTSGSVLNQIEKLGQFFLQNISSWIGIQSSDAWLESVLGSGAFLYGSVSIVVLIIGLALFLKGSRSIRLGLTLAALNLGFIYIVLWSTRPELLGGRHLYAAWAGVSISLGAAFEMLPLRFERKRRISKAAAEKMLILIFIVISAFTILQFARVASSQRSTLALTSIIDDLERQMKEILPEVSSDTRVFAARFTLSPSYFMPAAAVWYAEPLLSGGKLETLKEYPFVTPDFYLFDTDDGMLINLAPEFQENGKSYLLWKNKPSSIFQGSDSDRVEVAMANVELETIAGPEGNNRLSTCVVTEPDTWLTVEYDAEVHESDQLSVFFYSENDAELQIQQSFVGNPPVSLFQGTYHASSSSPWLEITVPHEEIGDGEASFSFESRSEEDQGENQICWSNPRLVVE